MKYIHENVLLLKGIRNKFDQESINQVRELLNKNLNWPYLLKISKQHSIAPLFYYNLQRMKLEEFLPNPTLQEYRRMYYGLGHQNIQYFSELNRILSLLEDLDIKAIVLKGAALAQLVWKNTALREMQDIDLLIREEDITKAVKRLPEFDYVYLTNKPLAEWNRKEKKHLPPIYNPNNGIVTELHHNILSPQNHFQVNISELWSRAQAVKLGDINALILCPEDMIIHLSFHFSIGYHAFGRIRDLADITQIQKCYGGNIDWNWIIKEAYDRGFINYMYYPLSLAKDLLDMELEIEILNNLKDKLNIRTYEDFFLTHIVKKNILRDETSSIIPHWVIRVTGEALIRPAPLHKKLKIFLEFFYKRTRGKDVRQSAGHPLKLRVFSIFSFFWMFAFKSFRNFIRGVFKKFSLNFSK